MRARFAPPIGDLTDPAFVTLYLTAASTDVNDVLPTEAQLTYWRGVMPALIARAQEIGWAVNDYVWPKLIGWQAGGTDVPKYGPYAQPPNNGPVGGWTTAFVDVDGAGTPVDPPPEPDLVRALTEISIQLDQIARRQDTLDQRLRDAGHAVDQVVKGLSQQLATLQQRTDQIQALTTRLAQKLGVR